MSDIDTIREALDWLPGIDEKIHALAALDRLQAQQSNAEPVAWAYFGDFPDGKRLISADNTNLWGSDGIPLYTHPPASTEPRLTVEQAMEVFRQWRALNTNGWSADAIWENLFTCLTKAAKP
jgi:hypothetical protein